MACQNRIVLLLMNLCAAHNEKGIMLKHVCLFYLLPNTTSYMQPLDQGVLHYGTAVLKLCTTFFCCKKQTGIFPHTTQEKGTWMPCKVFLWHWTSTMSAVSQNCFAKFCCSTAHSVNTQDNYGWNGNATLISPVRLISFLMLTELSLPSNTFQQPRLQLCAHDGQGRGEDTGNTATSIPNLSQWYTNGIAGEAKQMTYDWWQTDIVLSTMFLVYERETQTFPKFETSAQTRPSSEFWHYIPQAYNILK